MLSRTVLALLKSERQLSPSLDSRNSVSVTCRKVFLESLRSINAIIVHANIVIHHLVSNRLLIFDDHLGQRTTPNLTSATHSYTSQSPQIPWTVTLALDSHILTLPIFSGQVASKFAQKAGGFPELLIASVTISGRGLKRAGCLCVGSVQANLYLDFSKSESSPALRYVLRREHPLASSLSKVVR